MGNYMQRIDEDVFMGFLGVYLYYTDCVVNRVQLVNSSVHPSRMTTYDDVRYGMHRVFYYPYKKKKLVDKLKISCYY